jgi:hypothetical protein
MDPVLISWPVLVYNDDLAIARQSWPKPPQKRVWFFYLMVHMYQEYSIEAVARKLRVVSAAQLDRDIVQPFTLYPAAQSF